MQSLIDSAGQTKVNKKTKEVADAVHAGKMAEATKLWAEAEELIENVTNGVNFYNILEQPHKENSSNHITGGSGGSSYEFSSKYNGEKKQM